jgi:hypothetical protein
MRHIPSLWLSLSAALALACTEQPQMDDTQTGAVVPIGSADPGPAAGDSSMTTDSNTGSPGVGGAPATDPPAQGVAGEGGNEQPAQPTDPDPPSLPTSDAAMPEEEDEDEEQQPDSSFEEEEDEEDEEEDEEEEEDEAP